MVLQARVPNIQCREVRKAVKGASLKFGEAVERQVPEGVVGRRVA